MLLEYHRRIDWNHLWEHVLVVHCCSWWWSRRDQKENRSIDILDKWIIHRNSTLSHLRNFPSVIFNFDWKENHNIFVVALKCMMIHDFLMWDISFQWRRLNFQGTKFYALINWYYHSCDTILVNKIVVIEKTTRLYCLWRQILWWGK